VDLFRDLVQVALVRIPAQHLDAPADCRNFHGVAFENRSIGVRQIRGQIDVM